MLESIALSLSEQTRLSVLEHTVTATLNSFVECGLALAEIHEERLYRESHATFSAYCMERWQITDRRARQLIAGAEVVSAMESGTMVPTSPDAPSVPPPSRERHARALGKLPKAQRAPVWREAVETAPGGNVTAKHIGQVANGKKPPITMADLPTEPEALSGPPEDAESYELVAELEHALKENESLRETVASLQVDDRGAEIARLADRLGRMEGLLEYERSEKKRAKDETEYGVDLLRKIRNVLKVPNNGSIIPALTDLMR